MYVKTDAYMVKTNGNKFKLLPAAKIQTPPTKISQQNVREVVVELEVGGLEEGEHDVVPEGEDRFGNAVGARRLGMVLSHGCELDKTPKNPMVTMVQVNPLKPIPDDVKGGIRTYWQKRTFYLPTGDNDLLGGEHYADFRYLTTLRRDLVDTLNRKAVMNVEGRQLLHYQLFRFYARKALPEGWTKWPDEDEKGQT